MKKKLLFLLMFIASIGFSQKEYYFITNDGQKVNMHPNVNQKKYTRGDLTFSSDYALTGANLFYHDKTGKLKKKAQNSISEMYYGKKYYSRLKIGSAFGLKRLHEIIVESKTHILTLYYFSGNYLVYIFDKDQEKFVVKKEVVSNYYKKDAKKFEKKMASYFEDCPEFLKKVRKNYNIPYINGGYVRNSLFAGIENMKCF